MKSTFSRRVLFRAAAAIGGLLVVLLLVLFWPRPVPGKLDLRIAGRPQITGGAMLVSLALSNGTSGSLNVVDDTAGKPFLILDAGTDGDPPGSGNAGLGLGRLANTLKINLAPGAVLTNSVWLTNPPPRFRLRVNVRDLAAERRRMFSDLLRMLAAKAGLRRQNPRDDEAMLPATPWIETGAISTTAEGTLEKPKGGRTD